MRAIICALLFFFLATAAQATLPEELGNTFQSIDGIVIKVVDGEYLLDLGSDNGMRNGDLIAVMAPRETILHPGTGAEIGQIDHARAFLRIVRIKPDFAWARSVSPTAVIRPTDPVRRFGEIPTVFIDQGSDGHTLFNDLQLALPHLAWQPWGETTLSGPGLIFTHAQQSLTLHDETGTLLGSWPLTSENHNTALPDTSSAGKMVMIGPQLKGKATGLALADFDGDGRNEVAVLLDDHIEIGSYDGKIWTPTARFDLPGAVKPLTLDAADIDENGRFELLITAVRSEKLSSQIWGFDGATYRLLAKEIPWFWRVMDLPGEIGVILGQAADPFESTSYTGRPFRILWQDGAPQKGGEISTFVAPTLHGSQPFSAQEKSLWGWLDKSDNLTILDDAGQQLWQGRESYGGGEAFIETKASKVTNETQRLFIRSRLMLQSDTLILPQNEGSRSISNWRKAEKNRLAALRWNGYEMEKVWESPTRDSYLADFAYGDVDNDGSSEYLIVGTLTTGFFNQSTSALFLWKGPDKR